GVWASYPRSCLLQRLQEVLQQILWILPSDRHPDQRVADPRGLPLLGRKLAMARCCRVADLRTQAAERRTHPGQPERIAGVLGGLVAAGEREGQHGAVAFA